MKTITKYLLKETQHEKEQKALGGFIADIPGISDLPTGHVPQLNDALFFQNKDIYISKHSRYAKYPEHSHNFLELNYMVHGTCQQVINGELITINSVKYWTDKVKKETGVDFHFHALRHTAASMLAARNIPINTLVDFLGHANANTAQKYYITSTELAKQRLKKAQDEIY